MAALFTKAAAKAAPAGKAVTAETAERSRQRISSSSSIAHALRQHAICRNLLPRI